MAVPGPAPCRLAAARLGHGRQAVGAQGTQQQAMARHAYQARPRSVTAALSLARTARLRPRYWAWSASVCSATWLAWHVIADANAVRRQDAESAGYTGTSAAHCKFLTGPVTERCGHAACGRMVTGSGLLWRSR